MFFESFYQIIGQTGVEGAIVALDNIDVVGLLAGVV